MTVCCQELCEKGIEKEGKVMQLSVLSDSYHVSGDDCCQTCDIYILAERKRPLVQFPLLSKFQMFFCLE